MMGWTPPDLSAASCASWPLMWCGGVSVTKPEGVAHGCYDGRCGLGKERLRDRRRRSALEGGRAGKADAYPVSTLVWQPRCFTGGDGGLWISSPLGAGPSAARHPGQAPATAVRASVREA